MIVVISGPGGVGKGTIVRELVARDDRLWLSRSWTTRGRRSGEDENAYTFVSREQFQEHIDADGFLEWAEFLGNLYGTPVPDPPDGTDLVLEIEVQGARQVKERIPDALMVFVDAPSREAQADRLRGRGDPEEAVTRRVGEAAAEVAAAAALDMTPVLNDDLDRAVDEIAGLIDARR
jgi:guanylate kinase